jgi:hypothetical protein
MALRLPSSVTHNVRGKEQTGLRAVSWGRGWRTLRSRIEVYRARAGSKLGKKYVGKDLCIGVNPWN